jgi:hypothetical protein
VFLLRLSEDKHKWLKANVEGSINDFILGLINKEIARRKNQTKVESNFETASEQTGVLDELEIDSPFFDIMQSRLRFLRNERYIDEFTNLEDFFLNNMPYGYKLENVRKLYLQNVPEDIQEEMWDGYFLRLDKMSWEDRRAYSEILEHKKQREKCGCDPESVVYNDLTAGFIIARLDKDKEYTVKEISEKLELSYDATYKHVVGWLKKHGFKVGKEKH